MIPLDREPAKGRGRPFRRLTAREARALRRYLGARVRVVREELGFTCAGLARALACPEERLRAIERGVVAPPPELLAALARARGVFPGWFYRGAPSLDPPSRGHRRGATSVRGRALRGGRVSNMSKKGA